MEVEGGLWQVPVCNDLSRSSSRITIGFSSSLEQRGSPRPSQPHTVVTVSFLGLIRSGPGPDDIFLPRIEFTGGDDNCKLPRLMVETGLVLGLLSDSVNKGSVLYWVFVANIVL